MLTSVSMTIMRPRNEFGVTVFRRVMPNLVRHLPTSLSKSPRVIPTQVGIFAQTCQEMLTFVRMTIMRPRAKFGVTVFRFDWQI